MIIFHSIVALLGLVAAGIALFWPSRHLLWGGYMLVLLTIVSGVELVVVESASLLHLCVSGIGYLACVGLLLVAARMRLLRSNMS